MVSTGWFNCALTFFSQIRPEEPNRHFKLQFTGPKPIPTRVHIEDGFSLNMDPCEVMKSNAPALVSFTEEFWQEWNHKDATSVADDVLFRWRSDRQRFPPRAYEARNLVWKGSDYSSGGRSAQRNDWRFVGFPVTALDEILGSNRGPVEARRNTLVGQGFHLPFTIVLFTIMALEVLGVSPALRTDLNYGPQNFSCVDACTGQFSSRMLFSPFLD